jgi:hypothetical protein
MVERGVCEEELEKAEGPEPPPPAGGGDIAGPVSLRAELKKEREAFKRGADERRVVRLSITNAKSTASQKNEPSSAQKTVRRQKKKLGL